MSEERWNAVKNNDPASDSTFYYGVKTTGIFCLPSCKSKLPLRENVVYFDSYEQAVNEGFRPCKRCRPDLFSTYAPNEALLNEIRSFLYENYLNPRCLKELDRHFNISKFHLIRIFKNRFGKTPRDYIQRRRIDAARKLLLSTDMKNIDIAFNCGFSSYTAFFTNFKKLSNITPEEYRNGGSTL